MRSSLHVQLGGIDLSRRTLPLGYAVTGLRATFWLHYGFEKDLDALLPLARKLA